MRGIDEFSAASTLAGMRKEVLLTQCGYYTIKRVDSSGFTLGLPNLELRHAKARLLTGDLFKAGAGGVFSKAINAQPLQERNAKELADLFNAVLKTLSAKSSPVNEHQLRDLLKIYFLAAEADVQSEKEENGGRADLTFEFDDIRLIVEFKFARHDTESPRLLESAIKQISNHDYGNYVPLKRLRRFAMVYSAPKCKITLAEELRQ